MHFASMPSAKPALTLAVEGSPLRCRAASSFRGFILAAPPAPPVCQLCSPRPRAIQRTGAFFIFLPFLPSGLLACLPSCHACSLPSFHPSFLHAWPRSGRRPRESAQNLCARLKSSYSAILPSDFPSPTLSLSLSRSFFLASWSRCRSFGIKSTRHCAALFSLS